MLEVLTSRMLCLRELRLGRYPVIAICLSIWLTTDSTAGAQNGNETLARHAKRIVLATNDNHQPVDSHQTGDRQVAAEASRSFPPLRPASNLPPIDPESLEQAGSSKVAAPMITVASSLLVVLGLFAAVVWGTRKFGPGGSHKGTVPKEVMQTLGSMPIDARTQVRVLRIGYRILVLSHSGTQLQTLCEIQDPDEVREITAACVGKSRQEFATTLRAIEREQVRRSARLTIRTRWPGGA